MSTHFFPFKPSGRHLFPICLNLLLLIVLQRWWRLEPELRTEARALYGTAWHRDTSIVSIFGLGFVSGTMVLAVVVGRRLLFRLLIPFFTSGFTLALVLAPKFENFIKKLLVALNNFRSRLRGLAFLALLLKPGNLTGIK